MALNSSNKTVQNREKGVLQSLTMKNRWYSAALLTAAVSCCFVLAGNGQDEPIRVKTELVSIPVTVLDKQGRFLTELQRKDFSIFENGAPQQIEYFGAIDSPVTVMVVIDVSSSMLKHIERLRKAVTTFIQKLRPNDQIIVARFAERIEIIQPMTRRDALPNDLPLFVMGGGTAVFDAMAFSLEHMKGVKGRKAIVLFTDGESERDRATSAENLSDAEEHEALIYTIRFGQFATPMRTTQTGRVTSDGLPLSEAIFDPFRKMKEKKDKEINAYLTGLADKTGGRAFRIEKMDGLDKTFGSIVDELSGQYTLGYYTETDGSMDVRRAIRIAVTTKNASVRSRRTVVFKPKAQMKEDQKD